MDVEAYRKDYLAKLEAGDKGARSAASEFAEETDVDRLLRVAADTKAAVALRLEAINRLNVLAFDLEAFKDHIAEYTRILKELRTDRSAEIRRAAFRRLSLQLDRDTRNLLQESLASEDHKLIPDKAAATLLGFDDHASSRQVLRTMVDSADEAVRVAALRGLASDARSAALLEKVTADTAEPAKVRQAAALSLKVASPKRFAALAKKIVTDEAEDHDLRTVAMSALAHGAEVRNIAQGPRFTRKLEALADGTKSRSLKRSINLFKALSK